MKSLPPCLLRSAPNTYRSSGCALIQSGRAWSPGTEGICSSHGLGVIGHAGTSRNSTACTPSSHGRHLQQPSVYTNLFARDISGGIWNARGLCCVDHQRRKKKFAYGRQLAEQHDFMVFLETHSAQLRGQSLDRKLSSTHRSFWSDSDDSPNQGGIGIFIKQSFLSSFVVTPIHLIRGRYSPYSWQGRMVT